MLSVDKLCDDFEACLGWPYESPGSNDERGIDCSGMFVRAFRKQGSRIYHGSNTIWRKYLTSKGRIARKSQLKRGMAVFKWREEGDPQQDGLGNFYHIGLVTSAAPLRIVHASTNGMCVRADTDADGWTHWGALKGVQYPVKDLMVESIDEPDDIAQLPMLRFGSRGSEVVRLQLMLRNLDFTLEPDGIFGPMTREAVKTFQAMHSLEQDGIVGPLTWGMLEQCMA